MAPSPAPWAVLGDVLWCLGLGCLLGAARDAVRLALGEGPVRCFFRDIAVFAGAAVLVCGFAAGASAGGLARWYMSAAVLLGPSAGGGRCSLPCTARRQHWRSWRADRCGLYTKCSSGPHKCAYKRPKAAAAPAAKQKNLLKSKNPPKNGCKSRRKYYIISHT